MACSCGQSTATTHAGTSRINAAQEAPEVEVSRTLVRYTGSRQGSLSVRGKSGAIYHFGAATRTAMVAERDIGYFSEAPGFEVEQAEPAAVRV